ncbi:hypothetical protein glysoja_002212 [Glycine soja]|nr:hypothetical protein glysoja_002212 [Glycine soja]
MNEERPSFCTLKQRKAMSRRNESGPKLDLKLNLSPPRADRRLESDVTAELVRVVGAEPRGQKLL